MRLIDPQAVQTYEIEGATFEYRQALPGELDSLRKRCVNSGTKGGFDFKRFNATLLKRYIMGWRGVEDAKGQPVPFPDEADEREPLFASLPPHVHDALTTRIAGTAQAATDEEAEDDDSPLPMSARPSAPALSSATRKGALTQITVTDAAQS